LSESDEAFLVRVRVRDRVRVRFRVRVRVRVRVRIRVRVREGVVRVRRGVPQRFHPGRAHVQRVPEIRERP